MSTLETLLPLAQSNESALAQQSWLVFAGLAITVVTVIVVQGGLMLAHRAQWWQSDAPDEADASERKPMRRPLPETEALPPAPIGRDAADNEAAGKKDADVADESGPKIRRRSA